MYTGTIFNWHDNSGFNVDTAVVDATNRPLFMVVNSFDKGPEKLIEVDATMFNSLFGTMSYEKHGQAAIQAQGIINAGGRLLIKRVCAKDSGLANSVLCAIIKDVEGEDTKLLSWEIRSIDEISAATPYAPRTYAEVRKEAIKFYPRTEEESESQTTYPLFIITDIGRGVSSKAVRIIPDYDTSRGLEKMIYRFNIYEGTTLMENANISLDPSYTFNGEYYGLDKNRMTQITGEVIPEIFDQFVYDITTYIYPQYKDPEDPDAGESNTDYEARIAQDISIVSGYDLINAYDYKGNTLYKIDIDGNIITKEEEDPVTHETKEVPVVALQVEIDEETGELVGADLNPSYGNKFGYVGDYGSYGESPAKFGNNHNVKEFMGELKDSIREDTLPEEYTDESKDFEAYRNLVYDIAAVYMGKDTDGSDLDEIWDTDSHKIFAVCDANYHKLIKDCIANFVIFRKDCIFLRDCNIGAYSVAEVANVYSNYILDSTYVKQFNNPASDQSYAKFINDTKVEPGNMTITNLRSNFVADYGTTYQIVDPISKKNIEVTMLLDLAIRLTTMYIEQGPFAPLAGTYNGFQLTNAIDGTINFVPIITPTTNQKQIVDDLSLNYAIFEDNGQCVVQSNYTSQDKNTQLSFINNVLAIQEVARVVRTVCPRNRFRLITGSDMSEYAAAVSRVLQGYNAYFDVLEFTYTQNPLRSIQKIFYASINFSFNNWAQTEIFDLYALANTTTTSVNS